MKPNVDTLYSAALLDLSQSDVSLSIPDLPASQYALFSFYDVFGDNYANAGSGNVNGSGNYRVRGPQNGTFEFGVRQGSSTGDVADIMSPTSYGVLLIRWGVNSSNIDEVHGYQDRTSLSLVNSTAAGAAPKLTALGTYAISTNSTMSPANMCLELLAKYAPWNQPLTEASATEVNSMLATAGISNGTYTQPSAVDINAANNSAIESATSSGLSPANNLNLNNGWSITKPGGLQGNFNNGTDYAYRAAIASAGFLQLSNPNAVYPTWSNTSADAGSSGLAGDTEYTITRDESMLYTFSAKPPLIATGFWSLTGYVGNYLIPNDLKRYAIGDRSNITYADGTSVYRDSNAADGTFQILVQAADNPPPANWTSNWLPGPAGGGNMTALLRFYGAQDALLDGSYQYPVVTRQAAIINSSGTGTTASSSATSSSSAASSSSMSSGADSLLWGCQRDMILNVLACGLFLYWHVAGV